MTYPKYEALITCECCVVKTLHRETVVIHFPTSTDAGEFVGGPRQSSKTDFDVENPGYQYWYYFKPMRRVYASTLEVGKEVPVPIKLIKNGFQ